jgi:hypothetical protein
MVKVRYGQLNRQIVLNSGDYVSFEYPGFFSIKKIKGIVIRVNDHLPEKIHLAAIEGKANLLCRIYGFKVSRIEAIEKILK